MLIALRKGKWHFAGVLAVKYCSSDTAVQATCVSQPQAYYRYDYQHTMTTTTDSCMGIDH